MHKKILAKVKALEPKKRNAVLAGVIIVVIVLVLTVTQLASPRPSVAAYCKVYKDEKARLAKLPGDTWPSAVFDDSVGDASEFATSFARLEAVAPADIRPDVTTLQKLYKKVSDDPSQAISASLSGIGAEDSVQTWTKSHCSTGQ